jgi:hypothetical protein
MIFGAIGGMKIWQGKPKYSEKTYPSATLSTTKSHMTDPGLEPPDRSGGKPATNRLSYGAALPRELAYAVTLSISVRVPASILDRDNDCLD